MNLSDLPASLGALLALCLLQQWLLSESLHVHETVGRLYRSLGLGGSVMGFDQAVSHRD